MADYPSQGSVNDVSTHQTVTNEVKQGPGTWDVVKAQMQDMADTAAVTVGRMDVKDYRPMGHLKDVYSK